MARISTYQVDTNVTGADIWIGTDGNDNKKTKNFSPNILAQYLNENEVISTANSLRYRYDTIASGDSRKTGTISFQTEIGANVAFSSITTFILSNKTLGSTTVDAFLNILPNTRILIQNSSNINFFGIYFVNSITPHLTETGYYVVNLTYVSGNGNLSEDMDYLIHLIEYKTVDTPTPTLQSVTDEGDTTTTTVYLNGGAISDSINEQAVFAPAQVSTVNLNSGSGATLDSTGKLALSPDGLVSSLFAADNITQSITLQSPNKAPGSYILATTDDIPAVTGFVPYTGANQNVNLGEYELKAGQLTLDTTPTGTSVVGTTQWNDTTGVSQTKLKGGNVILKNGVDLVARVVNKVTPNATLLRANYTAVRISGAQGQRLAVAYAQANNDNNSADTLGLVYEDIATNQEGFIMTMGQFEEINTTGSLQGETWADGDVLYLSPTTAGRITNIKPTGLTGHIVVMGYVEYAHAIHGKIYVKIMNGWELDELHNVYINQATLANNDGLFYDSSDQLWKNETIASALGYTPFQLPSLTSGSVLFSNGTTIAQDNSNLFWDDTNNFLGIGTASPTDKLTLINGNFALSNARRIKWASGSYIEGEGTSSLMTFRSLGNFNFTGLNVLINTTTDAGFKLDVNGTARVSGTLQSTYLSFRTADSLNAIYPTNDGFSLAANGNAIRFQSNTLSTALFGYNFINSNGTRTWASGTGGDIFVQSTYAPTSGTGVYNLMQFNQTINQTGGANGITRGLYINPTLTAAADWRAIEVSNGGAYINTTSVQASAILQADSTTKGFLPPRMTTTQKNAITTPATGLMVYDNTLLNPSVYNGTNWQNVVVPNSSGNIVVTGNIEAPSMSIGGTDLESLMIAYAVALV